MKKVIVITSVFDPTEAVQCYAAYREYNLIVAGDKKTPDDWHCEGAEFLSVSGQESMNAKLPGLLPFHHYSRKMTGYLKAMEWGADCIIDSDDDNIPKTGWGFPDLDGHFDFIAGDEGFVNVYQYYTDMKIWPRGFPLDLISRNVDLSSTISHQFCRVGVWQGLADEDPDVDAIYRLTSNEPCYFKPGNPIVLEKGTICPFNTQNTMIRRELFPLLYLPSYVNFRFTDILRGLVAQPIMWLYDFHLGFTAATVVQKRNPHDYMKDFISEIPMYEHAASIAEIVSGVISAHNNIETNLHNAYTSLLRKGIVNVREIHTLEAWLDDIHVK